MKHTNQIIISLLVLSQVLITSCNQDKDDEPISPTISAVVKGSPSFEQGTIVSYRITIESIAELINFYHTVDPTFEQATWGIDDVIPSGAFAGTTFSSFNSEITEVSFDYNLEIPSDATVGINYSLVFVAHTENSFSSDTVNFICLPATPPSITVTESGAPSFEPGTAVRYHVAVSSNVALDGFWSTESITSIPNFALENIIPADAFDDVSQGDFRDNLSLVEFDYVYFIPDYTSPGFSISIDFGVTNKIGQQTVELALFVVEDPFGPIERFTAILLGGQSNSMSGSFLDAHAGQVILMADAEQNQAAIDIVYYFGSTHEATLCAPDDELINGGPGNLTHCESWVTKNPTRFGISNISASQINGANNDELLQGLENLDETYMRNLNVGDVIAFETVDGKKGLINVWDINSGDDGFIELEYIIQK